MIALMTDVDHKIMILKKQLNSIEETNAKDKLELKTNMEQMDQKYEDALKEVGDSIDQYVGVVNDTSSKQYDDFNQNLKTEFGKNLEQIQQILNNL